MTMFSFRRFIVLVSFACSITSCLEQASTVVKPQNGPGPIVKHAPKAESQTLSVDEDTAIDINLTASDDDQDTLSFRIVDGPKSGTLSGDGPQLKYVPNPDYYGQDSFTFQATDATGEVSEIATTAITVHPVNDSPVISALQLDTLEDKTKAFVITGTDVDSPALSYSAINGTKGTVSVVDASAGSFIYVPIKNENGSDSFVVTVSDGELQATAAVTVAIAAVQDRPVIAASPIAVPNAQEEKDVTIRLGSDVDGDKEVVTYEIIDKPGHGDLKLALATNKIIYTGFNNYFGEDTFTFKAKDASGHYARRDGIDAIGRVSITIKNVNDAPEAQASTFETNEDSALTSQVLKASDVDNDPLTYAIVSQGEKGAVEIVNAATGEFRYTPLLNVNGQDVFQFRVTDPSNETSGIASVTVNILPINDAPLVGPTADVALSEDNQANINLFAQDIDFGDEVRFELVTQPQHGGLTLVSSQTSAQIGVLPSPIGAQTPWMATYLYTPHADYFGDDSFKFKAIDKSGASSDEGEVRFHVLAVNDMPVAIPKVIQVFKRTVTRVNMSELGVDKDGDVLSFWVTRPPVKGNYRYNDLTKTLTYLPFANATGEDVIEFVANDGNVDSNPGRLTFKILNYAIDSSEFYSCAIDDGGSHCWGNNDYSQGMVPSNLGTPVSQSLSSYAACALTGGAPRCWGNYASSLAIPAGLVNPKELSIANGRSCALDSSGVVCSYGFRPILSNPIQISLGSNNGCAIDDNGVTCWGDSSYGVTAKQNLTNPVQVSVAGAHACALSDEGVRCWGSNTYGTSNVPALVNPRQVSTSPMHACALDDEGVKCWGDYRSGQLIVPKLIHPRLVSAGYTHTCALDNEGVKCWGYVYRGSLTPPSLSFSKLDPDTVLSISGSPVYNFGIVGGPYYSFANKTFVLTNNGSLPAENISPQAFMTSDFQFVGGAYPGTNGTCGKTLAAEKNCTVVVQFAPKTNGAKADTLVIDYALAGETRHTVLKMLGN